MTEPASDAWQFYQEVVASGSLWTLREGKDAVVQTSVGGQKSQALWSSKTRAKKVLAANTRLKNLKLLEISWPDFSKNWVPGLEVNGILTVLNWPGFGDAFYLSPADLVGAVEGMAGVG